MATLQELMSALTKADAAAQAGTPGAYEDAKELAYMVRQAQSQQQKSPQQTTPKDLPEPGGFWNGIKNAAGDVADVVGGTLEGVASIGTSMLPKPAGELAYGAAALSNTLLNTNYDPEQVQANARSKVEDLVAPTTTTGKNIQEYVTKPIGDAVGTAINSILPDTAQDAGVSNTSPEGLVRNFAHEAIPQAALALPFARGAGAIVKGEGISAARDAVNAVPSSGAPFKPEVQKLIDEGVKMTPGQLMGGTVKSIEDKATSIPFVGDVIKAAQERGIDTFNEAAFNRALAPIGQKLPSGLKGYDAVEHVQQTLSDEYSKLLPKLKGDLDFKETKSTGSTLPTTAEDISKNTKPSLREKLEALREMGKSGLPEKQSSELSNIIDKEVIKQFTDHGIASGETLKSIESRLGNLAKGYGSVKGDYHIQQLGDAVQEVQASLRDMVNQVNPKSEGELSKVNKGYANFKILQNAAASTGSKLGKFTPHRLDSSVHLADKTLDKSASGKGKALMQDLSSAGKKVLPTTVRDSGTAGRELLAAAIKHPIKSALWALLASIVGSAYTPWGVAVAKSMLKNRAGPGRKVALGVAASSNEIDRANRKAERAKNNPTDGE